MKECKEIRKLFVDALYDQLSAEDQKVFQDHLAECTRCAVAYRNMSRTAAFMARRQRQEPGDDYWDSYWDRLTERMQKEKSASRPNYVAWIFRIAAVLMLVGVGVVIGKFYFREIPSAPTANVTKAPTIAPTEVKLDQRVHHFLGRSEVLLLGLVNLNPGQHDTDAVNWNHQKKISHELIQEAKVLQGELATPEQRRMQKLVSDLEVILLQIANLEAEKDLPEIELVRSGVDRKGILLKINLEQMRTSSAKNNSDKSGI